ncbi:helix-turn-helix domain-containing protein (plasmid) [Halococcus dombrowskii]|uniref:Helix-turn-helix domain-containing protein n=1 Tax=Halococcus dombrowskii TaxID=179637 RepID=A0AAV3SK29_HALDO|nr:bacterio-opsin activator domain-containing protein [Halococcus dombrowskii]UOO97386.1 helix-turn-helix domain-containing protein [Halococcus dombrowskii]
MATIAEFTIPASEFALAETLERRPDLTINIDRVVAHNTTQVAPFIRVTQGEVEGLTEILEDDSSVEEVELFGETDDERFYRLVWNETAQVIGYMINERAATVQEATATDGEWQLRVLFPDRDALSATNEYARENDVGFTLERIYGPENFETARHNLTEPQHETLALAVEMGYYEVPRDIDAKGLSDELGISHQALSERHRRATKNLVVSALATVDEENDETPKPGSPPWQSP